MNSNFRFQRRRLSDLARIDSDDAEHGYLICDGVRPYAEALQVESNGLGSVLAVCANFREAEYLSRFPFSQIVLSGIGDYECNERMRAVTARDSRVSYQKQNCENLSFSSQSFDLVFCKEGLHHLARPLQGLYEMLRVCRKAVIFVESYDGLASRILEALHLTTYYEKDLGGNLVASRDNFVFRWSKRQLQMLLNSYYAGSGYQVDITLGWMSGRLLADKPRAIRWPAYAVGVAVGMLPGWRGNFATVMIRPGSDLPPDPTRYVEFSDEVTSRARR